jgi:hypothetical protein
MYVKKSDNQWQTIKRNIDLLFKNRMTEAEDWTQYGMTKQELHAAIMRDVIPTDKALLIDALGSWGFKSRESLVVGVRMPVAEDTAYYTVVFEKATHYPESWTEYSSRPIVKDPAVVQIAKLRHEKCGIIKRELAAFTSNVKKLYQEAPSINAFVKAWPPGRDLLGEDTRNLLDAKVEKRTTLKVDLAELNQLNGDLLRAKVAQ